MGNQFKEEGDSDKFHLTESYLEDVFSLEYIKRGASLFNTNARQLTLIDKT